MKTKHTPTKSSVKPRQILAQSVDELVASIAAEKKKKVPSVGFMRQCLRLIQKLKKEDDYRELRTMPAGSRFHMHTSDRTFRDDC